MLDEERQRGAALLAEVQRLRAALAAEEQRRSGGAEAEDEVVGHCWHPAAAWDFYHAANSGHSSASEEDTDRGEEGDEGEEVDEEEGDEGSRPSLEEASQDADNEEETNTDGDLERSPNRRGSSARRLTRSPESGDGVDGLVRGLRAASLSDSTAPAAPRRSIELSSLASIDDGDDEEGEEEDEGDEEEGEDEEEEEEEGASHLSVSVSSSRASRSSAACSVSSTPGFHDVFPYERNLYLLSRHYHVHQRLYSCPDAVTFRATHIHSRRPVVIKVSEGFSPTRSHPKEVRPYHPSAGPRQRHDTQGVVGLRAHSLLRIHLRLRGQPTHRPPCGTARTTGGVTCGTCCRACATCTAGGSFTAT